MSTMVDTACKAYYADGHIVIDMESGLQIRFPASANPRLADAMPEKLNHIEVSPFGLHWPDLDEDLSFRGLLEGNFGQKKKSA